MVNFPVPRADSAEVLRRAAFRNPSAAEQSLLDSVLAETEGIFDYSILEKPLPLSVLSEDEILRDKLSGADVLILFTASLGGKAAALLREAAEEDPDRAIFLRALYAERLDALCEAFCDAKEALLADGGFLTPRFTPGQNFPLSFDKNDTSLIQLLGICATPQEHTAARCRTCFAAGSCSFRKS